MKMVDRSPCNHFDNCLALVKMSFKWTKVSSFKHATKHLEVKAVMVLLLAELS